MSRLLLSTRSRSAGPPELSRPEAVGVSVVGFASAIGVGHLVAALVSPLSSPYRAVADAVVRLAPSWLVEFGKTLTLPGLGIGTADKVGLLLGVGLALLAVAVVTGSMSRASVRPARLALVAMGVLGLVAVVTAPTFGPLDLVAPIVAIGVGRWCLRWLHEEALAARVSPTETRTGGVQRRKALTSGVAIGAGALAAGVLGNLIGSWPEQTGTGTGTLNRLRPTRPAPPIPPGADFVAEGTPSFLTANRDFYRIDTALAVPTQAAADWSVRLHGLVRDELRLTYADLLGRQLVERPITLACVSNEVGGSLISTANFIGVDLRELLLEAGIRPGADQLFSTSLDGWTAGTPLDVLLEPDRRAMLALGMNGEPLPPEHGYPVRMVVPGLYGFVSATKWLTDLEVTTFDARQAYWLERGWSRLAPIKTESRIDKPSGFRPVPAGDVVVAGIAWAQHRGIASVEVRLDDGDWVPARLATEVNSDTWRMWRAVVTATPGRHTVWARATDRTGAVQTEMENPPAPDGATGYPRVDFVVV